MTNKNNNQSVNNSVNNDNLFEEFVPVKAIGFEFLPDPDEEELTDEQKIELYGFCW